MFILCNTYNVRYGHQNISGQYALYVVLRRTVYVEHIIRRTTNYVHCTQYSVPNAPYPTSYWLSNVGILNYLDRLVTDTPDNSEQL